MNETNGPDYVIVFRFVAEDVGTRCAAVYGAIWFYEQGRDGYAHPSLDTMSTLTGMSKSTVQRCLRKLQTTGYIERISEPADHTPPGYLTQRGPKPKRKQDAGGQIDYSPWSE